MVVGLLTSGSGRARDQRLESGGGRSGGHSSGLLIRNVYVTPSEVFFFLVSYIEEVIRLRSG